MSESRLPTVRASLKLIWNRFPWAKQLSEKYYSGAFSMFILHGNIYDLVPAKPAALSLGKFLQTEMFAQRDIVLSYCDCGAAA